MYEKLIFNLGSTVWIGPVQYLWDNTYWAKSCEFFDKLDGGKKLIIDECKKNCEIEPGCNAFMTTSKGKLCIMKKCQTPIPPPDRLASDNTVDNRATYYISGNTRYQHQGFYFYSILHI